MTQGGVNAHCAITKMAAVDPHCAGAEINQQQLEGN